MREFATRNRCRTGWIDLEQDPAAEALLHRWASSLINAPW